MKAPKYVIYTDHKANWNNKDEYIAVLSTNLSIPTYVLLN